MKSRIALFLMIVFMSVMLFSEPVDSLAALGKSTPVVALVDSSAFVTSKDTLFWLYGPVGSFTSADRVKQLDKMLNKEIRWKKKPFINLQTIEKGDRLYVADSTKLLITVTNTDAIYSRMDRHELADTLINILTRKNEEYLGHSRIYRIVKDILIIVGLSLLLVVSFWWIIKMLRFVFRKIRLFLQRESNRFIRSIRLKNIEILSAERMRLLMLYTLKLISIVVYFVVSYTFLTTFIALFPGTKPITDKLYSFILTPLKMIWVSFITFIPNLFFILVILAVFHYLMRLLKVLSKEIEAGNLKIPGFYPDWARQTYLIVRFLGLAFVIVVIFPYLPGSNSPAFKGVSIFLGILFSLGSSTAITNMVAGLVITYMRPFSVGDWVKIGSTMGIVTEKNVLTTRLRTPKNEEISIPNSTILTNQVQNYSSLNSEMGLILYTTITIGYDVPWRKVHQLMIDAAKKTEGVSKKKEPFVLQKSLDDFYISYELNAYVTSPGKMAVTYSKLHQNIQDCFNAEGVEIMSPHYRANRSGEASTVVPPEAAQVKILPDKVGE